MAFCRITCDDDDDVMVPGGAPCASAAQPCENAGVCYAYYQQYVCQCTVDWTGPRCQQRECIQLRFVSPSIS